MVVHPRSTARDGRLLFLETFQTTVANDVHEPFSYVQTILRSSAHSHLPPDHRGLCSAFLRYQHGVCAPGNSIMARRDHGRVWIFRRRKSGGGDQGIRPNRHSVLGDDLTAPPEFHGSSEVGTARRHYWQAVVGSLDSPELSRAHIPEAVSEHWALRIVSDGCLEVGTLFFSYILHIS